VLSILGLGKCGVAVIRISGPNASNAILNMTCLKYLPEPRKACLNKIIDPTTKEQLDNGLLLWFPGKNAFFLNIYFRILKKIFSHPRT
jgi:tRNA U34 5-carboxymethylaminomethyl modifying GTPase MnmE/TrmE